MTWKWSDYRTGSSEVKRVQGYTMVRSGEKEVKEISRPDRNPPLGARTRGCGAIAQADRAEEAAQEAQAQAAARGRDELALPRLQHALYHTDQQGERPSGRDGKERLALGCLRQSSQTEGKDDQIPNLENREEIEQGV